MTELLQLLVCVDDDSCVLPVARLVLTWRFGASGLPGGDLTSVPNLELGLDSTSTAFSLSLLGLYAA